MRAAQDFLADSKVPINEYSVQSASVVRPVTVAILGLPGAGKTTTSETLAAHEGWLLVGEDRLWAQDRVAAFRSLKKPHLVAQRRFTAIEVLRTKYAVARGPGRTAVVFDNDFHSSLAFLYSFGNESRDLFSRSFKQLYRLVIRGRIILPDVLAVLDVSTSERFSRARERGRAPSDVYFASKHVALMQDFYRIIGDTHAHDRRLILKETAVTEAVTAISEATKGASPLSTEQKAAQLERAWRTICEG